MCYKLVINTKTELVKGVQLVLEICNSCRTPSSGKTSVMVHVIRHILTDKIKVAACKIDCLETTDNIRYGRLGIPIAVGLSDYLCPDHFYVANLEEIWRWAENKTQNWLF